MNLTKLYFFTCIALGLATVLSVNAQQKKVVVSHGTQTHSAQVSSKEQQKDEPQASQTKSENKVLWTDEPFDRRLFIKNAGQFDNTINGADNVIYGAQVGRANAYFTSTGVTYSYKELSAAKKAEGKKNKKKEDAEEEEEQEGHASEKPTLFTNLVWVGANANPQIEADDKQSYPYIYPKGTSGSISTPVYRKITYKNLYPGIDVEYTIPKDKEGIKYVLIVHAGADLSQVKLKYANVDSAGIDASGNAVIKTGIGTMIDHTPVSYYQEGGNVNIKYVLSNGIESFVAVNSYDKSKTLLVDPFTTALVFTGGYNQGYDVDFDYHSNVYVQGAWGPVQLAKYNSAGTKQWIFNEATLNLDANACYGDFCVNRNNGECYCVEGYNTPGAKILKINTLGVLMTTYAGNANYQEMWRIGYNSCTNDLVIAGGGTNANNQAGTLDTALTTIILTNALAATCPYHDMVLLALDPAGTACYMVSSESCNFACTQASADDRLLKLPLPSLTPVTFNVAAQTVGSFPEDVQDVIYMTWSGVPTNGYNGAACSPNYLYTYDGATLFQQSKTTGAKVRSVAAGSTQQTYGGISVDACDNVYAADNKTVKIYNSTLTATGTIAATNVIYDLMLGPNASTLYITGEKFVTAVGTSSSVVTTNVTNPATCGNCNGTASVNLSLSCSGIDTTGATYLWSNGATTHTITGLCAGSYSVVITPPGDCAIRYIDSVTVAVSAGLTVTANATTPSFCSGGSTPINAGGATTYTWSPGTGLSATTGSTVTATPTATTTYTVTGTTGGCTGTAEVVVTVTAPPSVTATAVSPTICSGSSTAINAGGATTYTWSPGTGLSATTGSPVTANPTSSITYTVTGTTGGCTGTATVAITVTPTPTITANAAPTNICPGGTTTITAGGGTTYTWSPAGSLSASTGTSVNANPGSTTTYTVTGITSGCPGSTTVVVTVNSVPTLTVSPSTSICPGGNTILTAAGATSYTWTPSGSLSASTGSSVLSTPGSTTTYTVTGTNASGCNSSQTIVVTVVSSLTVSVTPSSPSICNGDSVTLQANGATTYLWSPPGGLSCTSCSNPTANPGSTTTYTVTGTSAGCTGQATAVVTVNPTPTVSINITSISAAMCASDTISLFASGALTYTWSPASGLNTSTGAHVIASPSVTTTYTVTGTSVDGCISTSTIKVTIYPTPTVTVLPSAPGICPGGSVVLTASGAPTYDWTPANSLSCSTCPNPTASPTVTTTYYVTGTSAKGCTATDSVTVTVAASLNVTITPSSASVCSGDSVVLNANGASTYTWSPPGGLSCSSCSNTTAYPGSTTTYTVTGTSAGCSAQDTIVITVNPTPTASLTVTAPSVCSGSSTTLTAAGGTSYTWGPATGLSATTGSSVTANPSSATTYSVTIINASGCSVTDSVAIAINPSPTVTLTTSSPPNICSGSTDTIFAAGASTYTWSPSTGLNVTTGTTVAASPGSTTTYTVVGSNASGCNDTALITINVTPTPTLSVTPASPGICPGDSVALSASGATTYLWSPPGGLSCTSCSNPTASPGSTTTFTVTGNNGACSSSTSVVISVGTLTVTATPTNPNICSGTSTTITAGGAATFTWLPATGLSATTGSVVTASPTVTTTYTVAGTSGSGCVDTTTVAITVTPTPTLSVTPPSAILCKGSSVGLTASGATTYSWSPPGGLSCTSCSNPTANPGSTITYTVTGTTGGCSSTDSVVITIDKPTVSPTAGSPAICSGGSTTLSATGASTYLWSPPGGLSCTSCSTPTASPGSTTTFTVIGTDTIGCSDTNSITLTVNPTPTITVSATDSTICAGSSTSLTATGASTYLWSPPGGLSCTSCSNPTANPGSTTTFTVVGNSVAGCPDTTTFTLNVNPVPTVSITASGGDTLCPGQSTTLTATTTAANYVWSTGATTSTITVNPATPTTYTVVAMNGKCSDSATVSIYQYPPLTITMKNDSVCKGVPTTISANVSGGKPGYTYAWSNGLGTGPGPFSVNPSSPTYYVCTVTDGCGSIVKDSGEVVQYSSSVVSFKASPDTIPGGQYVTFTNTSPGGMALYWNFGDGSTSTDTNAYHQYGPAGSYVVYLVGTNGTGCVDTAWDTIYVTQSVYIPNVFTPNGDGINDVFHVTISGMKEYFIEIFNRWGEKVFEADSPEIDWTGRSMAGVMESDGTYYYIIKATDYSNKQFSYDGYLQLIH